MYCGGSNGPDATIYGLEPHYPCCTVNLPQGWPKLTASAVLRDGTDGLLIAHMLPLSVSVARLGVELAIQTEYPFGDTATIILRRVDSHSDAGTARSSALHSNGQQPISVRLALRVPGWADAATMK